MKFTIVIHSNNFLQEAKPLTLNMEFEMTRPMLDFVIRLHKNGENPYDKSSKKRDARYRIKDKKFLLVDIKVGPVKPYLHILANRQTSKVAPIYNVLNSVSFLNPSLNVLVQTS